MKGFPKTLKTKEDYYNCLAMVAAGELAAADLLAKIESLELPELASSDMERFRLSLSLFSGEEGKLLLNIRDMGWGELLPGSGREWEYEIG